MVVVVPVQIDAHAGLPKPDTKRGSWRRFPVPFKPPQPLSGTAFSK